jgi:hypothetical protein
VGGSVHRGEVDVSNENKLGQELLLQCLVYDKDTGLLYHNVDRPETTFSSRVGYKHWSGRFAGKILTHKSPMGYVVVQLQVCGVRVRMEAHRVIWCMVYGQIPEDMSVDHINGSKYDNRLENLRLVPHSDNMANKAIYKKNRTGYVGVYPRGSKFISTICKDGEQKHLGVFNCVTSAAVVRKVAESNMGFHKNHGRDYNG